MKQDSRQMGVCIPICLLSIYSPVGRNALYWVACVGWDLDWGSSTIDSFEPGGWDWLSLTSTLWMSESCLTSLLALSSWFGASWAVILQSRAAKADLSCFNSSSLPHVFDTMLSRAGTSTLSLSVRSFYELWCWVSSQERLQLSVYPFNSDI